MKIELTEKNIKELANWIESSVEWLRKEECGCCTYKLDDRLALCVGWSNGFDPEDAMIIHSKKEPSYAIVAGIKVWTSDDLQTDIDWMASPYYEDGSLDVIDTDQAIRICERYDSTARDYLVKFNGMNNLVISENGAIVKELPENATIELSELDCDLDDEEEIKDAAVDYISDEVGYCINSVESISLENEGLVEINGIEWDKY